jgi:hypothetical protein
VLEDVNGRRVPHSSDQSIQDEVPGSIASCMNDPPARVRGLKAQDQISPGALPVEDNSVSRQPVNAGGRSGRHMGGNIRDTQAGSRLHGVSGMQGGVVVRSKSCGDAALRERSRCLLA